jgi:hypothetical protein
MLNEPASYIGTQETGKGYLKQTPEKFVERYFRKPWSKNEWKILPRKTAREHNRNCLDEAPDLIPRFH